MENVKACDHNFVGMFIWTNQKLLLIERVRAPFGFTLPGGHVDGELTFEDAARRELKEKIGFDVVNLEKVIEGRKDTECSREGGTWHYWKIYKVITGGKLEPNKDEVKKVVWCSIDELKSLAEKTARYGKKVISDREWLENPGLQPVILEWFHELKII